MMNIYRIMPADQAVAIADKLAGSAWPAGRARTKELTGTVKQNGEILSHAALDAIGKRIVAHAGVQMDAIPLKMHPPKFSRYADGQHYKRHTDAPWMGQTRTDLSCTLWLNDAYDGGELVVGDRVVRGEPGQCVVYECGEPHEVLPVLAGERICAVTWIQSRIRDAHKRRLASDMRRFLARIEHDHALFVDGGRIHSALLRMWIEA